MKLFGSFCLSVLAEYDPRHMQTSMHIIHYAIINKKFFN